MRINCGQMLGSCNSQTVDCPSLRASAKGQWSRISAPKQRVCSIGDLARGWVVLRGDRTAPNARPRGLVATPRVAGQTLSFLARVYPDVLQELPSRKAEVDAEHEATIACLEKLNAEA